jgi:hypothetical protein
MMNPGAENLPGLRSHGGRCTPSLQLVVSTPVAGNGFEGGRKKPQRTHRGFFVAADPLKCLEVVKLLFTLRG